jgi:predicted NAD/FAD-binding protein
MTTTVTPQTRRVLEAIADMSEAIAKSARLLADGQDLEAEETLTTVAYELREARLVVVPDAQVLPVRHMAPRSTLELVTSFEGIKIAALGPQQD